MDSYLLKVDHHPEWGSESYPVGCCVHHQTSGRCLSWTSPNGLDPLLRNRSLPNSQNADFKDLTLNHIKIEVVAFDCNQALDHLSTQDLNIARLSFPVTIQLVWAPQASPSY